MVTDVMNARMREGNKLAKGFEGLVRSIGLRFTTYEATIHGKVSVESSSLTAGNLHACFQYVMNMIFPFFQFVELDLFCAFIRYYFLTAYANKG